ncbi:CD1375 family protein [Paenibacillus sp. M1]|uniref:CD1375 family protein n=1 Tax=Paenibacillus haidiansis TaxID=1574488 RepID=A0ABU7VQD8_9BACL
MEVKAYMVHAYAMLVKGGRRTIESLPPEYQAPVTEYLAELDNQV